MNIAAERLTDMQQWEVDSLSELQQQNYYTIRDNGNSHNMAIVLATRSCPRIDTDKSMALANNGKGEYYGALTNTAASQDQIRSGKADPRAYCSTRMEVERRAAENGLHIVDGPERTKKIDVPSKTTGYKPYEVDPETARALQTVAGDMAAGKEVPSIGEQRRCSADTPLGSG